MLSGDVLFLKDQNHFNFFGAIFHMNNTEDVNREMQSFAELSYVEPAEVPNSICRVLQSLIFLVFYPLLT